MTAIIIDDEKHIIASVQTMIRKTSSSIDLLGTANDYSSAKALINAKQPDLIFLDIEIGTQNAFDLLAEFSDPTFQVIFITAHSHYALKAFKVSAIDYLLKPIDELALLQAIQKAQTAQINRDYQQRLQILLDNTRQQNQLQKLIVREAEAIHVIDIAKLAYFEADGTYTKLNTFDKQFTSTRHLKYYDNLLVDNDFIRVHRSYLVNGKMIRQFQKSDGGMVILENGIKIPVSVRKKEKILNYLSKLIG